MESTLMRIQATTRLGVVGVLLLAAVAACNNDLTVQPKSTITSANIFNDTASYRAFLAKLYAGLVVTGQSGPDGNPDIGGIDEGFSQYVRSYWHALDLFGNVPLVDENFDISQLPKQATRTDVFSFVESELKAILAQLPAPKAGEYGRADQAAVNMVLAHLYLNAKVYTGTDRSTDARAAVEKVISSGAFSLDPTFRRMFSANNNTSPELIFAVPQDGVHTRTWGGMTYLVHAGVGGNMNATSFGIDGGWWGLRLRPETVDRYEGGAGGPDHRTSFFFTDGQTKTITDIGNFQQGIGAPKYTNVTTGGQAGSNATFPDTDYPMFRLADAYLVYAEAVLRGGGGDRATALGYVNAIRERAYGGAAGDITDAQLTLPFILDERSRELLWE